jgi:hypothetical protein
MVEYKFAFWCFLKYHDDAGIPPNKPTIGSSGGHMGMNPVPMWFNPDAHQWGVEMV